MSPGSAPTPKAEQAHLPSLVDPRRRLRAAPALAAAIAFACLAAAPPPAAAAAPQISAAWSTEVVATSARLHAEIDPEGAATTYHFDYLTAAAYEANLKAGREGFQGALKAPAGADPSLGAGTAALAVYQILAALSPETAYRYRVVAVNGAAATLETNPAGAPLLFTTEALGGASLLLDGRAWEMVSPPDKNGGQVDAPESLWGGGDLQAAAAGGAVTFSSEASFGEGAAGSPPASQYLSTRSASGWATRNITPATPSGSYGDEPDGVPFRLFSSDLSRTLMLDGRRCEAGEECPRPYSLWEAGAFRALPGAAAGMRVLSASADLGRVVFEAEGGPLYEWSGGGLAPTSLLPSSAGPGATFQAASSDRSFSFYTEGGHLYRYSAGSEAAADLTPSGGVEGVLGIAAAGAVVYYQAEAGLFRWDSGTTTQVAAGADAAQESDWPPATGTSRVSGDGSALAFLSKARLTGYDNTDQSTALPDSELFLWRAGSGLACVSCNPTNERPIGPASIPGAVANGSTRIYKPRDLVVGGGRLFFDSADALVLSDTNGAPDAYEWEADGLGGCAAPGGCLGLLSSGRFASGASFADASASGADAFFLTEGSLLPADPGSLDLYDAREGGGFPEPPTPIACEGDACQSLPSAPEDPQPGTLLSGPGNPSLHFPPRRCPKRKRRVKRHGKVRCVARHKRRRHARRHVHRKHRGHRHRAARR
jgi:hypothetical protein